MSTYTSEDAKREVGNSTDWAVGFKASLKKWEKIASGEITEEEYESGEYGEFCGFCFVDENLCEGKGTWIESCNPCPAHPLCRKRSDLSPKMIRHRLRQLGKRKGWL